MKEEVEKYNKKEKRKRGGTDTRRHPSTKSILDTLPRRGTVISFPGLWEQRLVVKDGGVYVKLQGRLVDSIISFATRVIPGSERYTGGGA